MHNKKKKKKKENKKKKKKKKKKKQKKKKQKKKQRGHRPSSLPSPWVREAGERMEDAVEGGDMNLTGYRWRGGLLTGPPNSGCKSKPHHAQTAI